MLAFLASGVVGFGLTWGLMLMDADPRSPIAWSPPPLRPPPLDLPSSACSQVPPSDVPNAWSVAAAEAHLESQVADHESVDLLEVDCQESPCIAWLRWQDGRPHPDLTYRWWSLDDAPDAALWTASHSFRNFDALIQAVVIAPARPSSDQLAQVQRRVDDGLARFDVPPEQ